MFVRLMVEGPAIENAFAFATLITFVAVGGEGCKLLNEIAVNGRAPNVKVDPLRASKLPLLLMVTVPEILPGAEKPAAGRPLRIPPVLTKTLPLPVALPLVLFTWSVPALIVVLPV